MRIVLSAFLYTALALSANTARADIASLEELREGTLKKLVFAAEPIPGSSISFADPDGNEFTLSDWQGKYVLLNFWATWCAPCRKEMTGLNELQKDFGGEKFEVLPIATGRNALPGIRRFFEETEVSDLPILLDPKGQMARDMGVLGLPVTVLIDPEGKEIARLRGDADWGSESARAIVETLIADD